MANKVTKKDNFTALRAIVAEMNRADLVEFIDHELELLAKKAENRSTKPTVRQAENAEIKAQIVASMESGRVYRCTEVKSLISALAQGEGTQRTARLCNDLVAEGLLVKTIDKKVVYFALAE